LLTRASPPTSAYPTPSPVANGGTLAGAPGDAPRPATVARVLDARGDEVYTFAPQTRDALDPALAWLLSDMLAGGEPVAVAAGRLTRPVTPGPSPPRRGRWWASGRARPTPPIRSLRASAIGRRTGEPVAGQPPPGLTAVEVCALSGPLPRRDGPACPTVRGVVRHRHGAGSDGHHDPRGGRQPRDGALATILTPANLIERRVYTVYPPEAAAWAADQGIPRAADGV
jgi:hypothetical protein